MAPKTPEEAARPRSIQRIGEALGIPVEAFYEDGKIALQVAQTMGKPYREGFVKNRCAWRVF